MAAGPVRDFLGTANGEWAVVNGDFAVVGGADAVPQGIRVRVGLMRGEVYLDETKGVPYLDDPVTGEPGIIGKDVDPLVAKAVIGEAIADTPDVTNVVGAQVVQGPNREAAVAYSVDTVYTTVPFTGQVGVP